ncbi:MAG: acyl-CoA thioesterase [Pseudomonadota bacterium]
MIFDHWDHPNPHVYAMTVGHESIDVMGHANNVEYLRWLEHVAWDHSNALGLDWAAYQRLDRAMVARRTELEYLAAAFEGDELLIGTWIVENDRRVSITRQYQLVRPRDAKTLLRGRTQWVCVEISTGALKRMPPEFVTGYRPTA